MPELCRFYGIIVTMYAGDHVPPHFHVRYGSHKARVAIDDGRMLDGDLPSTARKLVAKWRAEHANDLAVAWERAQRLEHPGTIAPLD